MKACPHCGEDLAARKQQGASHREMRFLEALKQFPNGATAFEVTAAMGEGARHQNWSSAPRRLINDGLARDTGRKVKGVGNCYRTVYEAVS